MIKPFLKIFLLYFILACSVKKAVKSNNDDVLELAVGLKGTKIGNLKSTYFYYTITNKGSKAINFNTLTLQNFVNNDWEDIKQGFSLSIKDSVAEFNGGCGRDVAFYIRDLKLVKQDSLLHIVKIKPNEQYTSDLLVYGCDLPEKGETKPYHQSPNRNQKINVQLFYENYRDTIKGYNKKYNIWTGELKSNVVNF